MELLAVFSPLVAFVIAFFFGSALGHKGCQFVTCTAVLLAAYASINLFFDVALVGGSYVHNLTSWIVSGDLSVNWALRIDTLSVVMLNVITIVSSCVHVYSLGYMSHDVARGRFMSYLSLFTFAMLMLVTSDNLVQLFFGWEGVGLASYLLIGFWNHKHSANAAAQKAFVVNRVGDFGLALGLMSIFVVFGTLDFTTIFAAVESKASLEFNIFGMQVHAITAIALLLFVGAVGKSAQLGLHTWLPDAMEGPTPVSALIHAATMVTAGVFLVARMSPLYEFAPIALMVVAIFGAVTCFVAATIGMTQFDIKRVIAYSTMSQLGYMFFALGVSAYGAAMFHLMTHAFFKALLFLGAGSVIHAMSDEQDMRKMGGIWKKIPYTYVFMWIGSLALAGIPPFAGYFSKDIVLEAAWSDHSWFGNFAFTMGILAAFMTAFYSWRLLFMTFHGKPRATEKVMNHIHESPPVMLAPLAILGVGAILAGLVFMPQFAGGDESHGGHHEVVVNSHDGHSSSDADEQHGSHDYNYATSSFWAQSVKVLVENDTVTAAHGSPLWVKKLPLVVGIIGIFLAYLLYIKYPAVPGRISQAFRPVYNLFFNKWFFDEIYNSAFVQNSLKLGRLFWSGDKNIIDKYGPDGSAYASEKMSKIMRVWQSGYIYHYAFVMIVAVIAIISWFIWQSPENVITTLKELF